MHFAENSNLNNAVFGKYQNPVAQILLDQEEALDKLSLFDKIFTKKKSTHFGESYVGMTSMDNFEPVAEGGRKPEISMQQGFDKFIPNTEWGGSFVITRAMADDGLNSVIQSRAKKFEKAYYRSREQFAAMVMAAGYSGQNLLSYKGFQFDVTGADGLPVFSASHVNKVTGTTQSNVFSNALNVQSIGEVETAMQNFTGDKDEELAISPDTIIIPNIASMKDALFAAIESKGDPLTANNKFNYQNGRWNVIIWQYWNRFIPSGVFPWIMLDSQYNEDAGTAIWQERVALEVASTVDSNNSTNQWDGYARHGAGFNDFRGIAIGGISGGTTL